MHFTSSWTSLLFLFLFQSAFAGTDVCIHYYRGKPNVETPRLTRIERPKRVNIFSISEQKQGERVLDQTLGFAVQIDRLLGPLKRYELENLFFRVRVPGFKDQYLDIYRNSEFLKEVEFIITDSLPTGPGIINGVNFGYQNFRSEKVQVLGTLKALELGPNKNISRIFFSNEKQLETFKAHFFGQAFTRKLKDRIVHINTAVVKALAETPRAAQKVLDFEKARGWPEGTAKKMGLVYYSKDVFDLKSWAMINRIRFDDMVHAGWFHKNLSPDGRVSYRENYDDSIKIPMMDLEDRTKVALWRTRNLQVNSRLPKYLSWPKDRSLYADHPLFEEFYNSWNLDKVKGKRLVITEGEFKCAIAEMTTGIYHFGVPGITQFSSSILKKLVAAQPSEVIVLFDRDPLGKGYLRLDEVTDSQRASFLIAKTIEKAGIPVRVASLPDVFNGKKVGADDLILARGVAPYLTALDSAVSANKFAELNKIDINASLFLERRNKISKALAQFRKANTTTLGYVTLEQRQTFQTLLLLEDTLDKEFRFYIKTKYPGRSRLTDPGHQFDLLYLNDNGPIDQVSKNSENFEVDGPILRLGIKTKDAKTCKNMGCFELNRSTEEWNQMDSKTKLGQITKALEAIFPLDDYVFIESPLIQEKPRYLLVIRKESRSPVAVLDEILTLPN